MKHKITLDKIKQFIQGNTNMLLTELGTKPEYYKEQIAYRMLQCKDDCLVNKECKYCGCKVPGKLFVDKSCNNNERFPDIMNEEDWNNFKMSNNI